MHAAPSRQGLGRQGRVCVLKAASVVSPVQWSQIWAAWLLLAVCIGLPVQCNSV